MSQKYYARPREEVEAEINRWSGVMDAGSQTAFVAGGAPLPGAGGRGGTRRGLGVKERVVPRAAFAIRRYVRPVATRHRCRSSRRQVVRSIVAIA